MIELPFARAVVLGAFLSGTAYAQTPTRQPCELVFETNPDHPTLFSRLPSGATNIFAGGGVRGVCRGQDITLTADSAEYYGDLRILYLLGTVRYREPRARLESRKLTYWMNDERLLSEGDVVVTLPSGTVSRGPIVDYLRAAPAVRTDSRMEAPRRTITRIPQKDSAGGSSTDTVQVEADRTLSLADSVVYAGGNVRIVRGDLLGVSDSAFMDNKGDIAQLLGKAQVDASGKRPFTLSGAVIDLFSKEQKLERVLARVGARAKSQNLELASDTIDMRVTNDELQRAYAWGPSRARATSPGRVMTADSLDIVMPAQKVREVRLLRAAYAESDPDSTRIRSTERDWLRGDTIIAYFDTTQVEAAADSSPQIRELVAKGKARSFYHVASSRGGPARPSVNYVRGREIVVSFVDDEVTDVLVRDAASGVYIEPSDDPAYRPRSAPAAGRRRPGSAPAPRP